jgi:uncharacterized Zn finger protein (UPF0148 family)
MTMPGKPKAATRHTCRGAKSHTYGYTQCRSPAKVERDGEWYCGIHDPARITARRIEANSRSLKERERKAAEQRARDEIVAAAIEATHQRTSWDDVAAAVARLEALAYA